VRLAYWLSVRHAPFIAQLAMDSREYDRWALSLAAGRPAFPGAFFQPPFYPYLLATLYRLGGHHLAAVYLMQIGLAVAGCYALFRAGRWYGGPRTGLWAAFFAALYGPFLFYDVQLLRESLAVTAVAFLLWALAAGRARRLWGWWALAGALAGTIVLLRENMLLVFPCLLLLTLERGRVRKRSLVNAFALLGGFFLMLLPPALHNRWAGGGLLPTTFRSGVNFYIGNNPQADGTYRPISPGKQVPSSERTEPVRIAERQAGRKLAAAEVSQYWLRQALDWARAAPGAFARLQLRKLRLFWEWYERPDAVDYYYLRELSPVLGLPLLEFGGATVLALAGLLLVRRRLAPWAPVLLFTAAWTASTVTFFLFSRYRLPVVPALLLLAAVVPARAVTAWREGRRLAVGALAALVAAAWIFPHLLPLGPRWDLVHYNLARLADEDGDEPAAVAHYRAALAADPADYLACLNLGTHAARAGRYAEALAWFRRTVDLEPRFDDAWADLGSAQLALGDVAAAEEAFDRALALNPENPTARHNQALAAQRRQEKRPPEKDR
jgi:4-amino-4-deoxy-L-arabinose transferase-like glycosyltransferase